jgi:hypothetical protein
MRTTPETLLAYAEQCRERARTAANPRVALQFRDLAEQWTRLAGLVAEIEADTKEAARFFISIERDSSF